jgi:hypothetical protein
MNSQIETWRVQQYTANVYHLSQQKGSRVGPVVRTEVFKGKSEAFDRLGLSTAQKKTSRNSDTPNLDIAHSRRTVTTAMYEWATLVDRKDKLQNIHDPENQYSISARNALGRSMDDVLISAALGSAATGEDGSGTTALGTAQNIVALASGNISKMNVNALLMAKNIFDAAEVEGPRYFIHTAGMLMSMLQQTQVTSSDYNTVRALVRGEIDTYLGFKFIHSERLPLTSATASAAYTFDPTTGLYSASSGYVSLGGTEVAGICFIGDGLLLGKNEEAVGRIDERTDKSYSHQVYASMDFGAVRMEEVKVVQINALP